MLTLLYGIELVVREMVIELGLLIPMWIMPLYPQTMEIK
jgi:hypothetical protein